MCFGKILILALSFSYSSGNEEADIARTNHIACEVNAQCGITPENTICPAYVVKEKSIYSK